jgi:adenine-specific DNA-methyltransferase
MTKSIGEGRLDGNPIINGDNLHASKSPCRCMPGLRLSLIRRANTGNEGWCYNDNVNSPYDAGKCFKSNPVGIEDGLRHDKWCDGLDCLLHELLGMAKPLGDPLMMQRNTPGTVRWDSIFGEQNFAATCICIKNPFTEAVRSHPF